MKKSNISRRYILESPLNNSINYQKQNLKRNINKEYQTSQLLINDPDLTNLSKLNSSLINSNKYSSHINYNPSKKFYLQQPTNSKSSIRNSNKINSFQLNSQQKTLNNKNSSEKKQLWYLFTVEEKRNLMIYILGIMLYKFGLEAFNGSIVSLATNRYDRDAFQSGTRAKTFEKIGLLVGMNQACQCIGSILISPLTKRFSIRIILTISIFIFALFTALLMIIDGATGGKIKPNNYRPMYENDYRYYGKYPTTLIIPIYCLTGIAFGMVELIRRIIPQDIVGNNEEKLQRMDSLVHIFYEISGVSGALTTGLILIPRLGNNYAFIITPILFTFSSIIFFFIKFKKKETNKKTKRNKKRNYFQNLLKGFLLFGQSIYFGGKLIFTNRKYFWLFPCYTLTLYVHRYIENGLAPQIAKRYLQNSEWSQIIVAGSNFGELCGALTLFILTKKIRSPIVWLRLDCLLLLIIWYIPFYHPNTINIKNAWIIALSFIPFGFGAAGDDVSLNAHIQATLSDSNFQKKKFSSLGSVMAFLYSSYIILYAILNPLLGKYIDHIYQTRHTIQSALIYTGGVQITIISILVFLTTFIPRHSFKLNPSLK